MSNRQTKQDHRSQRSDQSGDKKAKSAKNTVNSGNGAGGEAAIGVKVVNLTVTTAADGQRLDNFLLAYLRGAPRSLIYRIIRRGEVRVNSGRAKADRRLVDGDRVRIPPVRLPPARSTVVVSQATRSSVAAPLYEDEFLLVVNKPSGLAVHAGSTLASGLVEQLREYRDNPDYLELAHRLDRETSGCLILAKSRKALLGLHEQFRHSATTRLRKEYVALVRSNKHREAGSQLRHSREIVCDEPLPDARDKQQKALSIFTPLNNYELATLMNVTIHSGRKHQIRRHAMSLSLPVAGDDRYGDFEFNRKIKRYGLKRIFLHASSLEFQHPMTHQTLVVESDLPDDLRAVLNSMIAIDGQ